MQLAVLTALCGTLAVNLSLLFLYLQMGILQHDALPNETLWPLLYLIGYHTTLISISVLVWKECYQQYRAALAVLSCQMVASILTILFFVDYVVTWDAGVVIVNLGVVSDNITLWLGIAVGIVLVYSAIVRRLEDLSDDVNYHMSRRSSKYFLLALVYFTQFLVPRAESGSIVDPFSVKLIGFLITISFGYSLYLYSITEKPCTESQSEILEQQNLGPSLTHLIVASVLALLFYVAVEVQPLITHDWRSYLQSQSLFVGTWFNTNLYLNYIAVISPLACWMLSLMALQYGPHHKWITPGRRGYIWLLLTGVMQMGFFWLVHLLYLHGSWSTLEMSGQTIMPILVSPVIAAIVMECIGYKSFWQLKDRRAQLTRIVCLFGVTLIAALVVDLIVSLPPFSPPVMYVFLGAAGLSDGLFWAPIMSVVIFETVRSIKELL
jgi:hypothetical protein